MDNQVTLTDEQEALVVHALNWFNDPMSPQTLEYTAPAGCGKTFIMHYIIKALHLTENEVAPMAFSGAAALNLRRNGFKNAKTIHSSIYECVEEVDDSLPPQRGIPKKTKHRKKFIFKGLDPCIKLICLDEASMVSADLKEDIDRCHVKVLCCGDINQLPCIIGNPVYLTGKEPIFKLTKIMRQSENSAIVQLSNLLKDGKEIQPGNYGEVLVIRRNEFEANIERYVREYGIVLCGTNKFRDFLNKNIREKICHIESPLPIIGEKLICRKNHWSVEVDGINLVNGLCGVATSSPEMINYDKDGFFKLNFRANFMTEEFKDLQVDYEYFLSDSKTKAYLRSMADYNQYEKFEFAYAITTHVAQGSQFDSGIYVQEYFPHFSNNLNYTGLTRFRYKALYVLPNIRKKYWFGSKIPRCKTLIDVPKVR